MLRKIPVPTMEPRSLPESQPMMFNARLSTLRHLAEWLFTRDSVDVLTLTISEEERQRWVTMLAEANWYCNAVRRRLTDLPNCEGEHCPLPHGPHADE